MARGEQQRRYFDRQLLSRRALFAATPVLAAGILGCAQPNRSPEKPAPVGVPHPATVGPPIDEPTISPPLTVQPQEQPTRETQYVPLSEQKLNGMFEAMRNSGFPLFSLLATKIKDFRTSPQKPTELPYWIHPQSAPLQIATNSSITSYADVRFIVPNSVQTINYTLNGINTPLKDFEGVALSMRLGLPSIITAQGPLQEAFPLSKEFIQHMIMVRLADEYYKSMQGRVISLTDSQGKPITDPEIVRRAGIRLFYDHTKSNQVFYDIIDGFPTLLLGVAINSLVSRGKLPVKTFEANAPFYFAAQQLNQNTPVHQYMLDFTNDWVRSQAMIPPVDSATFLKDILNQPISTEALKLQDRLRAISNPTLSGSQR